MSPRSILKSLLLCLLLLPLACAPSPEDKARRIARQVIDNMGGEKGWNDTRYLAWTFRDQYQVWDKQQNRFRWEMDSLVVLLDTNTKDGKVYVEGKEMPQGEQRQQLLEQTYGRWINNSYWLVMPFKLLDPGVNLTYRGEEETMDGAPADVLEMTFEEVGLTPQNKYKVWVDKQQGLVTQWAYFPKYEDAAPAFTRRWSNYRDYGSIKLASDRSNPEGSFELPHIAAPGQVPDEIFNSPTPIEKL